MVMYVVLKNLLISYVAITELETELSSYNSFHNNQPTQKIWAVAENYRFVPSFVKVLPPCTFGFHLFRGDHAIEKLLSTSRAENWCLKLEK